MSTKNALKTAVTHAAIVLTFVGMFYAANEIGTAKVERCLANPTPECNTLDTYR